MKEIQKIIDNQLAQNKITTLYWVLGAFNNEISELGHKLITEEAEALQRKLDNKTARKN